MKNSRGFTIVEIAVVITIIATLVTIVSVVFATVQKQARDTKRQTDMRVLGASLEKYYDANGEYPSSCPQNEYNSGTGECASRPLGIFIPSNNTPINQTTTYATLKTILKTDASSIKDPFAASTNPFGIWGDLASSGNFYYLYIGDMTNSNAGTVTNVQPFQMNINGVSCTYQVTVDGGKQTSYVLAYYNETDGKIHLAPGRRGAQPTVPSGQPCVIDTY